MYARFYQAIKELTNCLIISEIDPARVEAIFKQQFKAGGGSGFDFKSRPQQNLHLGWEQHAVTKPCGFILNGEMLRSVLKCTLWTNTVPFILP